MTEVTHVITPDSNDAERFLAQCKRDLQLYPRSPLPEIRADFARRGFCLHVNGEPVGAVTSYKKAWLNRELAIRERS